MIASNVAAAAFEVNDAAEFQVALTAAESNGEFDSIWLNEGYYSVTTTLHYDADIGEDFGIEVETDFGNPGMLSGGNALRMLHLTSLGPNARITIRGLIFVNGYSAGHGGGLSIETDLAQITLDYCAFYDNAVDYAGAGVSAGSNHGIVHVFDCDFQRNVAGEDGGGASLWTTDGVIRLETSEFRDNVSTVDDGAGAALTAENGTYYILNNHFEGNSAGDDGGGLLAYSTLSGSYIELIGNEFTGNTAALGGAGAFCRINSGGEIVLTENDFTSNTIQNGSGGGLFVWLTTGPVTVTQNTFLGNESLGEDGGGTWIWSGNGTITLDRNVFTGNQAFRHGGGAMLTPDAGTVEVFNCIFDGNDAGETGGGMIISSTATSLHSYNNVYYANSSVDGAGGLSYYTDVVDNPLLVTNDIYWMNTPDQIGNVGLGVITVTYSDVQGGTGEHWFGIGCIDADPMWWNPGAGSFEMTPDSPCVDAANGPVAPMLDFWAMGRYDDPAVPNTGVGPPWVDIGAHELVYNAVRLEYFTLSSVPGCATARWAGYFTGDPGEFRVIGMSEAGQSWELEYRRQSDGVFVATDTCEQLMEGGEFRYKLLYREEADEWSLLRGETVVLEPVPMLTALRGAYPNPFNPSTVLRFSLDAEQRIRLRVLDASGSHVTQLAEGIWPRGDHEIVWEGRDDAGRALASGVYLVHLEAAGFSERGKLVLIR